MRATRAIIYLDNIAHNIREIKKLVSAGVKICLPVKADAYGHGAVRVSLCALENGADCLGVATVDEGAELRKAGITAPVLLFTLPHTDEIPECVRFDLEPFVYDARMITMLDSEAANQGKRVSVHLKIDTGMGRAGCRPEDTAGLARNITLAKHTALAGICTHLAVSDSRDDDDITFTKNQFTLFMQAAEAVKDAGIDPGILHCAASGGVLFYPETHLDMARPGIMTYGYFPGDYKDGRALLAAFSDADLRPAMELRTSIIAVKMMKTGETVSYGRTWRAEEDEPCAVLPAGYGDGLRRSLSPGLIVRVNDASCGIAGRICMDQCMIRLKNAPSAKAGDSVILFGDTRRGALMDAGTLAEIAGTIPYEILCGISKRVPRMYK